MAKFSDMLAGYHQFRSSHWENERERWDELAEGQSPKIMLIACSDSRVEPGRIFDTNPGEIFVVRNVAALVPPFETTPGYHGVSAALEFAVQVLEVEEIVVLGHGACGGCHAALTQSYKDAMPGRGGFIADWISLLDDARDTVIAQHGHVDSPASHLAMEHEAIKTSLANLRSFAYVRSKDLRAS